jgi:predicted nuclease of predicted toxin-antitoxin system
VKLLLDANLSYRILTALADEFPGSAHVRNVGLERAGDDQIWRYARDNGFTIVTLDSDFYDLSVLRGAPPKVVWLRSNDTATDTLTRLLQRHVRRLREFSADPDAACLELRVPRR